MPFQIRQSSSLSISQHATHPANSFDLRLHRAYMPWSLSLRVCHPATALRIIRRGSCSNRLKIRSAECPVEWLYQLRNSESENLDRDELHVDARMRYRLERDIGKFLEPTLVLLLATPRSHVHAHLTEIHHGRARTFTYITRFLYAWHAHAYHAKICWSTSIPDKSVSFEKSVSFSDEPPDMNSPKQHSPQHAGNG